MDAAFCLRRRIDASCGFRVTRAMKIEGLIWLGPQMSSNKTRNLAPLVTRIQLSSPSSRRSDDASGSSGTALPTTWASSSRLHSSWRTQLHSSPSSRKKRQRRLGSQHLHPAAARLFRRPGLLPHGSVLPRCSLLHRGSPL
jgi:hypothetical protein